MSKCCICSKNAKRRCDEKTMIYVAMPDGSYALHREDNEESIFYCFKCYLVFYEKIPFEEELFKLLTSVEEQE